MTNADDAVVRFRCRRCFLRLKAPLAQVGTQRRCPRCQLMLEVPTAARAARANVKVEGYRFLEEADSPVANDRSYITVTCPLCGTLTHATPQQVGQQVACPDCETPVVVPPPVETEAEAPAPAAAEEGYQVREETDPSPAEPEDPRFLPVNCPLCNTFVQAGEDQLGQKIPCPDCGTPIVVNLPSAIRMKSRPGTMEVREVGEYAVREDADQPCSDSPAADESLIAVECPLCNTRWHATLDQVGQEIRCSDCGELIVVPPPPPPRRKRDLRDEVDGEYGVEEGIEVPQDEPTTPDRLLRPQRGAAAGGGDERPPRPSAPPRWTFFSGIFHFPLYRSVRLRWLALSLLAILVEQLVVNAIGLERGGPSRYWMFAVVLYALTIYFGIIWVALTAAYAVIIIEDTAAGNDQIENWPAGAYLDWIGDSFYVLAAGTVCVLPGLAVARVLGQGDAGLWLCIAISLLAAFPIVLLSMLETRSWLNPVSLLVLRSLRAAWWTWGVFYGETTLLVTAVACVAWLAIELGESLAIPVVLPLLVATLMIYFRLLGRLAWRCGGGQARSGTRRTKMAPRGEPDPE